MTASRKWSTKRRQWPNGRVYWVVSAGGAFVAGKRGGVAKFYDLEKAQSVADEMNGKKPADTGASLIE